MIRFAEAGDVTDVVRLAQSQFQKTPYKDVLKFDRDVVRENFFKYLSVDPTSVLLIVSTDGPTEPVHGVLAALATPTLFSNEKVATELLWAFDEGHRKDGVLLFRAYEFWQKKIGCKVSTVSTLNGVKRNYTPVERIMIK